MEFLALMAALAIMGLCGVGLDDDEDDTNTP